MGETELHHFLKKLGVAYLHNQKCSMVAMEVGVTRDRGIVKHKLDNHYIMDVVGLGKKYIPYPQRGPNFSYKDVYYRQILRGIEVKISKADLKNGFCCTGCNYHYLLTPMRLVNPAVLPKWVGLLEYNKHKFKVSFDSYRGFNLEGLRVVKKPKFREITHRQLEKTTVAIGTRLHWTLIGILADELRQQSNDITTEI